jgi:hypothetical protein
LTKRPEIAKAGLEVQFFALAWFLRTHEGKLEFTSKEIMDRLKQVGIPCMEVPFVAIKFCDLPNQHLLMRSEGTTSYYSLTLSAKNHLDEAYKDCLQTPSTIATASAIADLPKNYPTLVGCPYWQEMMLCHKATAYRATVIMAWNLIYNRLCDYILADPARLSAFNLKSSKPIANRDDFTEFREADVLAWSKSANIIIPNVHVILAEKLKRRNMFAHASGIIPIQHEVDAYILDLITNVLPRLV